MTAPERIDPLAWLDDAAVERALDTPMGLDHKLRDLIRGDTVTVGYSKVDVVRHLLAALPLTDHKAVAELVEAARSALRPMAELAHESAERDGLISRGAVARHCTGDVGPDYYLMAARSIEQIESALAAFGRQG